MFVKKEQLTKFLIDSNNAGYAGGEEKKWIKEPDGSTTIPFEKGPWKSHDNFFGGEPYGGRTIVFYKGKPVWIMVYYGWVEEGVETNPIYGILRNALKQMPEDYPFRGPKEYREGEYSYTNSWKGEVERFLGEEKIITAFKKTAGFQPTDELNADMSSSLEETPRFQRGEDVMKGKKLVYKANYMGGLVDQRRGV